MLFQDPENGEICQVAGWGRVQREKTYTDDEGNERKHKGPVDLMEVNISSVVEFQRWWVLKSKVFAKNQHAQKKF